MFFSKVKDFLLCLLELSVHPLVLRKQNFSIYMAFVFMNVFHGRIIPLCDGSCCVCWLIKQALLKALLCCAKVRNICQSIGLLFSAQIGSSHQYGHTCLGQYHMYIYVSNSISDFNMVFTMML
ncbi:hypothetical protein AB205_0140340 [Aquarana catesbeiana]|uniref:Uncharacterized protein n=1 Tax=Aquarana catesbeiana TaxID=8400 RepID=A0A2G9R8X0_AQUCT|nr:hypothetical protein AB205_0140340 [Aquarana catesbeiana]